MIDYIKKQILAREEASGRSMKHATIDADENKLINEYAHLFQELDDISVEGTDSGKIRKMDVDIPLEDDIEIESIEMNLADGRVVDVPADAAIQESLYKKIKTFDDFYQEAVSKFSQLPRESENRFKNRCNEYASKRFNEYSNYIIQEGLFGFDKIDINDNAVPSVATIDFGPIKRDSDQHYFVKLPVLFKTDNNKKVLKKQLASLNCFIANADAMLESGDVLLSMIRENNNVPDGTNVWDIATPTNLFVPVDPIDQYKVVIEFEIENNSDKLYLAWAVPIKSMEGSSTQNALKIDNEPADNFISKRDIIRESFKIKKHVPNRFVQEAIDFNDSAEQDGATDNDKETDSNTDVNTDNTDTDVNTTPVDSNDVSDKIADKIASDSDNNKDTSDTDDNKDTTDDNDNKDTADTDDNKNNTDADDNKDTDDTDDMNTASSKDESTDQDVDTSDINDDDSSIDDKLDDLDTSIKKSDDDDDDSTTDFDNMTVDQLIENGSEKLKGMTIKQLKSFLNDNNADAIQEAFILTKKNINSEVDTHIRKALGILNASDMSFTEIVKTFKHEGKRLNRVLSKAYKMKDVYSDEELNSIMKLNKILTDLMMTLKVQVTDNDVAVTKRLIKIFTVQCTNVSEFVERKKMDSSSKNVQESFDDCFDDTDIVVQEVNLAGNITIGVLNPIIGGIVTAVKISRSGVDTHTSIVELLTMLNSDPSIDPRKLIKKLKKLADNCLYLEPKVSKISESDQLVKLRTMCKSFANFIKTNGVQNEAFKNEVIGFAKQCAVVDKIIVGDQKKISGATNNVQEDALISVGPAYNPANGNPIGEK